MTEPGIVTQLENVRDRNLRLEFALAQAESERIALADALRHEFWSHKDNMGDVEAALAVQQIIDDAKLLACERCNKRKATMLLGKGLAVCNICYRSPEDVIRDLTPGDHLRLREARNAA